MFRNMPVSSHTRVCVVTPHRIGPLQTVHNESNDNWFSRDQGLATLASLTNTPANATTYNAWLAYIVNHTSMCPNKFDCLLVPQFWCTFDKVAHYANLTRPPVDVMVPNLGAGVCNNDHAFVLASTILNANGSALHLASVDVYIRRMIGDWDAVMQAAADHLHARQPISTWFEWLSNGASDELVARMGAQVPPDANHQRDQWSFVREDAKQAWNESMGWEFIALSDLMLGGK